MRRALLESVLDMLFRFLEEGCVGEWTDILFFLEAIGNVKWEKTLIR